MSTERVSYWAQVWQAGCAPWGDRDEHVRVSPPCATQQELVAWLRPFSTPGYQIRMMRREIDGNSYKDVQLVSEQPMTAEERRMNLQRVQALISGATLPTLDQAIAGLEPADLEPF